MLGREFGLVLLGVAILFLKGAYFLDGSLAL